MNWTQRPSIAVVCHNTLISSKNMPGALQCGSARFDGSEVSEPAISNAVQDIELSRGQGRGGKRASPHHRE